MQDMARATVVSSANWAGHAGAESVTSGIEGAPL